jgi:hypothetical protein
MNAARHDGSLLLHGSGKVVAPECVAVTLSARRKNLQKNLGRAADGRSAVKKAREKLYYFATTVQF